MKPSRHLAIVAFVTFAACNSQGGVDDSAIVETTSVAPDQTVSETVTVVTSTLPPDDGEQAPPSVQGEPLFEGLAEFVTLSTPPSGGGIRPLLEWEPVDGAAFYTLFLYAPSGRVYWSWAGTATSVHVGGEPQIDEDRPGAAVSDGMSWAVIAYDTDSLPIAVSARAPIGP